MSFPWEEEVTDVHNRCVLWLQREIEGTGRSCRKNALVPKMWELCDGSQLH
jgi:hypothetical protein